LSKEHQKIAVQRIESREALSRCQESYAETVALREGGKKAKGAPRAEVLVGMATCGVAAGAVEVVHAIEKTLAAHGIADVRVVPVGCLGYCYSEPTVQVNISGQKSVCYEYVDEATAERIVTEHIQGGKPVKEHVLETAFDKGGAAAKAQPGRQYRIALRNSGFINPEDIWESIAFDGYQALAAVLLAMTPEETISVIKASGLRGRGGGGFPAGLKWEAVANQKQEPKYVICNADEGDPGAFMDRAVLEGDPHAVLEAMTIAGYAVGAHSGIIYVRAEYPLAIRRLTLAIEQSRDAGFLGENIFGSGFNFDIDLRFGAGAFVCGEETALIHSAEGKRGTPRSKPPFPASQGYFDMPTLINNVETFANIPLIIRCGADWFRGIGTEKSPGTKVFSLCGHVNHTGLIEVPMGTTFRQAILEIGGGIPDGKTFKAVQTGGPSGGCIPAQYLDTPIEYETLKELNSMMGSGGMVVMDEESCMVDIAKFYLEFTVGESCGKCTPCRVGNKRLLEMLNRITQGNGTEEDLDHLADLSEIIKDTSACGLGQTSPNPVLSTMKYFSDEYYAHAVSHRCPTGVCRQLVRYKVTDKCIGCTQCARNCPVLCIEGKLKQMHTIRQDACIKCGTCMDICPVHAIVKE
jgi:NADH:ubiquinone oxidoreductase subunit F (NADH-binding)/(2Fe-2S) ferredoxin/NAD-dependent dihydropyrimidine dehydrogenase PreA subunit